MTDAVIVDVDGTLCDVSSLRKHVSSRPKNFDAFHAGSAQCPPIAQTLEFIDHHYGAGRTIVVVTARCYRWEGLTRAWLNRHVTVPFEGPFMRGDDDYRPDVDVKRRIHEILVHEHGYRIVEAIDDNPAIVALWQELGIPTTVVPGWRN